MGKAVAFTGPSNAGKTTLIAKISILLSPCYRVAIIKNDPKDKARFDIEGKDSHIFFQTGADVIVSSPTRTTMFSHRSMDIDEMAKLFGTFDYLLVEGLKHLPLPRIGVFRGEIQPDYLDVIQAVAIDDSIDVTNYHLSDQLQILNLNNPEEVIAWINTNAKEMG